MALLNFPELEPEVYKSLADKGYWYLKTYHPPLGFINKPLHRKAALLLKFFYLYPALFILSMFVVPFVRNLRVDKPYITLVLLLAPVLVPRLLLWGKVYNATRKDYLAVNKGKRDGLYTSGESLYTTKFEGIYICQTCSTPVASTDTKMSAEKPFVVVSKLFDEELIDVKNNQLACTACHSALGEKREGAYYLYGEKLALDASELHLIYP